MEKKPGGYVNIKRFQVIFTLSCEKERSLFSIVVSTFDYNSLKTLYRISRRKTEMIGFSSESFFSRGVVVSLKSIQTIVTER